MASDVMRVRLHLREIRVLAVALDTPSELRVEVESTVRRPRCPACGFGCVRVHGTRRRKVRDLEVSGRRTTLVWLRRRFVCDNCSTRHLEDHREFENKLTRRLSRRLVADARVMTLRAAARRHGLSWHLINGVVKAWSAALAEHRRSRRCAVLLVDETSMRKRHRYVTVIVNGDTGKTLAMVQHRNAAALSTFLMQQGHRWCKGVKVVVSDGSKAYKSAIDARRAAREVLGRQDLAVPRARGRREALRALESTRRGAQTARTAAINELKALIISAPVDLRDQLRGLTTAAQVAKCAAFRLPAAPLDELTATKQALRSLAPRIKTLTTEAADLQTSIRGLVEAVAPHLLDQPGVGPITAAQIYIAWSHPGRCRNEAAFARLAGVAPLEASSGQNTRHRLNRRGDRQLNRALHTIAVTRSRYCPHTQAYIAKRTAEGKTPREAQRCLKRYIARQIYRLLQHPKINT